MTRVPYLLSVLCLASSQVPTAQTRLPGAFEQGREVTRLILGGEIAPFQAKLSKRFIQAIGGPEGLASFAQNIKLEAGRELEVLEEHAFKEAGSTSYYRISRFERMPRVTTRWVWGNDGLVTGGAVRPSAVAAASPYLAYRNKSALQLPMREAKQGAWYVAWGGRDPVYNKHSVAKDQRFAYDFVVMEGDRVFRGNGSRNEDHFCFGEPIVAPARGIVLAATDGEADNIPGKNTAKTATGNHVVIDHGHGEHSVLAHLRLGSVAVKPGQKVRAGDALGVCGNSGKSDLPHLHYHLQTGSAYLQGFGLPSPFSAYFLGGRFVERGEPRRGDLLSPSLSSAKPNPAKPPSKSAAQSR